MLVQQPILFWYTTKFEYLEGVRATKVKWNAYGTQGVEKPISRWFSI